ncbi:beta-ketoacyl-[acyl-carrier-protein] synthase family protein [Geobacter sp. DSM 9736]|uniref:beta-ketoacyl-[acyl-carrier-protein] synthase family protein n=1 Tax=Geobacter sp. DSM 9736 TaxID=1277350 RepID=UPI000B4FE516|nr:beta-ketoacyl-[acyl-carrier-protein] synthase family protein [Geobacter sp. DSM 9736]SNB47647.1 3-oxoacyl-[acyl-carrier-protein] synthase II [Geobacter sp. DSM 9736]
MFHKKRIAITGLGVFCSVGHDVGSFKKALLQGNSGIGGIDLFDVSSFPSQIGAQIRGYNPGDHFDRKSARRLSRADQFGIIAAGEAIRSSAILGAYDPYSIGVSLGAGAAGMIDGEQWLRERLSGKKGTPSLLRGILPDRTSTAVASHFGLGGYQGSVTTACSSSATAVGWGADLIASGELKACVCGGSDTLSLLTFAGFNSLRVVDPEPCSPFSLGRHGISLGEGAAFVVLEAEDDARARGATVYGYILGYAVAGEAFHMTAPEPNGVDAARVMEQALLAAGVSAADVGWVNAHGTGTPLNDVVESKAMRNVFGEHAADVPLVSTKAMTGHCLGAAGSIEILATALALGEGIVPQTLNFRGVDPECDLDHCHGGAKPSSARVALSNSFAFGGNITCVVIGI